MPRYATKGVVWHNFSAVGEIVSICMQENCSLDFLEKDLSAIISNLLLRFVELQLRPLRALH
jgi:hypothetical protein